MIVVVVVVAVVVVVVSFAFFLWPLLPLSLFLRWAATTAREEEEEEEVRKDEIHQYGTNPVARAVKETHNFLFWQPMQQIINLASH